MKQNFSLISGSRQAEKTSNKRGDTYVYKPMDVSKFGNLRFDHLEKDLSYLTKFPEIRDMREIENQFGPIQKILPKGYKISKKLGKGAFGTTFSLCKDRYHCLAMKVVQIRKGKEELKNEVKYQKIFHAQGLAPEIMAEPLFYTYKQKTFGVIFMEQIDGILDSLLQRDLKPEALDVILVQFLEIVRQLNDLKIAHRDMHTGNISYQYVKDAYGKLTLKLNLIDFGWATTKFSCPALEIAQFLRTMPMADKGEKPMTKFNQNYMWPRVLSFYQRNFKQSTTYEDILDDYDELCIVCEMN